MAFEKARPPKRKTAVLAIDIHMEGGKVLRLTEVSAFQLCSGNADFQSIRCEKQIESFSPGTVVTNISATALNLRVYPEPKPARRRK